jgi:hypothetical protein
MRDLQLTVVLLSLAVLVPMVPLESIPEPLAGTIFTYRGMASGVIPFFLALAIGVPLFMLLRSRPGAPRWWFPLLGITVTLIPAAFYFATRNLALHQAPVLLMAAIGLGTGTVAGLIILGLTLRSD